MSLSLHSLAPTKPPKAKRPGTSLATRLVQAWSVFEASRMRRARREVLTVLQGMDDATLAGCGYRPNEIEKIRAGFFVSREL